MSTLSMRTEPVLSVERLTKRFLQAKTRGKAIVALNDVSLTLHEGEWLGLVGESGSGKTTLARIAVGLESFSEGKVRIAGYDLSRRRRKNRLAFAAAVQFVYQDPFAALDPRKRAVDLVAEPLIIHRRESKISDIRQKVMDLMEDVGLDKSVAMRRPRELSGGQCQRLSLARALALSPRILVLDEPTSALDVTVQAQMVKLLRELGDRKRLSVLVISHDLALISQMCDRIAVMYVGEIVEEGQATDIVMRPRHPYTQRLISAVPKMC